MRTWAAVLLAAGLVVAGCGSGQSHRAPGVDVVASTSVWGSVAAAVAGKHARVTSIISSAVDDPHSYEASASDAAAISDAALVVYNGGGYDHFVDDVLAHAPAVKRVDVFTAGGHAAGADPHVFYDPATASAVANAVADQLAAIDVAHAADYRRNAGAFTAQVDGIRDDENVIAATHSGSPVAATEDVATYLIAATKLTDRTPPGYYRAVRADTDPAPADMAAMLDLVGTHSVRVLLVNPQTMTSATTRITDTAKTAGVPVVDVTETLPAHTDFVAWQRDTIRQLAGALS